MRTSDKKVNKILKTQVDKLFFQALSDIKTEEEAEDFVSGFLTAAEKEIFVKRLAIAYWLKKGRSYSNIKENLKVSSATISSVQGILEEKGMQNAIKKLEAEEWANQWSEKIKNLVGK